MMKKKMIFMLCTMMLAGSLCFTACGNNGGNNGNNGSEAPYQDETQKKVNENNMYNNNDMNGTSGSDLEDAGRNLMDSIKDTGDAIRDGVDNLGNGNNQTNP